MATITSAVSGNWSATATWVGAVVPTAADDVIIAAGHNVTADIDFTVLTLSVADNVNSFLTINTSRTITCTGNNGITGKNSNGAGNFVIINTPSIIVNINSNIRSTATGNLTTTLSISAACTVNIVGNISNIGTTTTNNNTTISIIAAAQVNITGDLISTATTSLGSFAVIRCSGLSILNVVGNIVCSSNPGVNLNPNISNATSPCTINITGNLTAAVSSAIVSSQASTINVIGIITASDLAHAISSSSFTSIVTISTACFNSTNGTMAILAPKIKLLNAGSSQWQFETDVAGVNKTLYEPGVNLGNPAQSDVRDGVTYASGALTGELQVPSAGSVAVGVPVDNTVGTAIISITDMGALLASYSV